MAFDGLDDYAELMPVIDRLESRQAIALGKWVKKHIEPSSIVDIGCATGIYLLPFVDIEHFGVDAEITAGKLIPDNFQRVDLRYEWDSGKVYDLAYCIEVAEHLQPEYAEQLIKNITSNCKSVIFTAAAPGQGGMFHHNEQPKTYWIELFRKYGFGYHPKQFELQMELSLNSHIYLIWMRYNTMFLTRKEQ